jgi:hypothetical protein
MPNKFPRLQFSKKIFALISGVVSLVWLLCLASAVVSHSWLSIGIVALVGVGLFLCVLYIFRESKTTWNVHE